MSSQLMSARVKSVVSGDTVILVPLKGAESERQLSLAFVSAPRLSTNEPFGFEAREYLRTLLVGKPVQFKVFYNVNGREYGDIAAPIFPSLIVKMVSEGYAKVREDSASKDHFDEFDLERAQEKAKESQLGVWSGSASPVPEIVATLPVSADKTYKAIVEKVVSGDRVQLRVLLGDGTNTHFLGQALLAGLKSPRSTSGLAGSEPGEPFGDVARTFVGQRLLQRSVTVVVLGTSNTGIPVVIIGHPAGDIAELILSNGLGQVADWHSALLGPQKMKKLREVEASAKEKRLGLWGDVSAGVGGAAAGPGANSFEGVVTKVISADTLAIRNQQDVEKTVQLASLCAPRKSEDEVLFNESKEFVRAKLIGKKVNVTIIYVRPKSEQFDEREIVSVKIGGLTDNDDISLAIVRAGYASVIRHKGTAEDRSPIWDELVAGENEATSSQKGIHSKKKRSASRIVDASENVARAHSFESSFQRQGTVSGVVDYISSGGRFRITVPRENCTLWLVLSGIRVPKPKEPSGDKALDFAVRRLWQRDVKFEVVGVDKTGAFIGHLYLASGGNIPFSIPLVKNGLAEIHEYSAQQSGFYDELMNAEAEAKKGQLGIWEGYIEEEEEGGQEQGVDNGVTEITSQVASVNVGGVSGAGAAKGWASVASSSGATAGAVPAPIKYIDVTVTNIDASGNMFYRDTEQNQKFEKLTSELTSYNSSSANSASFALKRHPKSGDVVALPLGSKWARARITQFTKPDDYDVFYIDTGASDVVTSKSMRTLASHFSVVAQPALAKMAVLSYVDTPPRDYLEDYVTYLKELLVNKKVACRVDATLSPTSTSVTLFLADSKGVDDSVNNSVVFDGYAFVSRRLPTWADKSVIETLRASEASAMGDRVGVWEYGDPREDD